MEDIYMLDREELIEDMEQYDRLDEVMEDNSIIRLGDLSDVELIDFAMKLKKDSDDRNKDFSLDEEDLEGLREMAEHFSNR